MHFGRGIRTALNSSGRYKFKEPEYSVDNLVIGGGVVGLAIAQRLSRQSNGTTFLVERHARSGEETSSRNSEVIHSGLYYPSDSLKTRLCLRGRHLMYERCRTRQIPYRGIGKLVVATDAQRPYIENLHRKCLGLSWPSHSKESEEFVLPTELILQDRLLEMEPDLSKNITAALWCPTTGIVDTHAFMEDLERDIIDSEEGEIASSTDVVRIDRNPDDSTAGWVVQLHTSGSDSTDAVHACNVINAAGLASPSIANAILPEAQWYTMYYAKGSYASYKGNGVSRVNHLLYPCPDAAHSFQSLGTHLTIDMLGKLKFGPDLQWISPPKESDNDTDFWSRHLVPDETRLREMHAAVTGYLPGVTLEGMQPDYCGIRPKLVGPGGGFQDFILRADYSASESSPMISCLGIESPGLTASLAIAEYIVDDMLPTSK